MRHKVNFRRGFFRTWIAFSALWLVLVGAISYERIASPNVERHVYVLPNATSDFYKLDHPSTEYRMEFKSAHWQVDFPNNVTLYPTNDVSKAVVDVRGKNFYEQYSKPREAEISWARWAALGNASVLGVAPPLVLLVLGLLIGWIATGFKSSAPHGRL